MTYHVSPAQTCNAPAKWFGVNDADRAMSYARQASATFHVAYCVYAIQAGKPRLVKRFNPGRATA